MNNIEDWAHKFSLEFPNLDAGLILAIASDADSEDECRQTLTLLDTEAQFQTVDWKAQESQDLESALRNTTEQFSAIEIRDGKLAFKAEDDPDDWITETEDFEQDRKGKKSTKIKERKEVSLLCRMFPTISRDKIKSVLTQYEFNIDRATEELLSFEALQEYQREEQFEAHLRKLEDKANAKLDQGAAKTYPRKDLSKDILYLEKIYKIPAEKALDILENNDCSLTKAIKHIDSASAKENVWAQVPTKKIEPAISYSALVQNTSTSITTPSSKPTTATPTKVSWRQAERKAAESSAMHAENVAKASMAYRKSRSNPLYRQVAGHYSEQARKHNDEKHVALNSHFNHILSTQSSSHCIDLHGLPLHFAVSSALEKLHKWWPLETQRQANSGGTIRPLKLISGAGRHSSANIPKIKNGLRKKLMEEKWIFQEHDSYFMVTGAKP